MLDLRLLDGTDLRQFAAARGARFDARQGAAPAVRLASCPRVHQRSTIWRFAMTIAGTIRMFLTTATLGALIGVTPIDDALGQAAPTGPQASSQPSAATMTTQQNAL